MKNLFGQHLRKIRKDAGATQEDLANFCGCTKQYLSDIETGRNNPPNIEILKKIALYLNLSAKEKEEFEDCAARERGDIATDIKEILNNYPHEIKRLRETYAKK